MDEDNQSMNPFKWDWSKMPCFRTSYLTSISAGVAVTTAYFIATSRVLRACHFGFGTYVVLTPTVWLACSYRRTLEADKLKKVQTGMAAYRLYHDTEMEKQMLKDIGEAEKETVQKTS